MEQVVTQNTRSTTDQALAVLTEKILNLDGLTLTQLLFRRERWVPERDIQRLMDIGVAGTGGRSSGLVSSYVVPEFMVCDC